MNRALLVAVNDYPPPGPPLRGCLNDIADMATWLKLARGFTDADILFLRDSDATAQNIRDALAQVTAGLIPGDRLLVHYSGHGAQLQDGDNSSDVLCSVDFDWSPERAIGIADLHAAFSKVPAGAHATLVCDSCHSGALAGDLSRDIAARRLGVPRLYSAHPTTRTIGTPRLLRELAHALDNLAFISGCESDQTSADAYIGGRFNGALTYMLLQVLDTEGDALVLPTLIADVGQSLAVAGYDQVPCLTAPDSEALRAFVASMPGDVSAPATC